MGGKGASEGAGSGEGRDRPHGFALPATPGLPVALPGTGPLPPQQPVAKC